MPPLKQMFTYRPHELQCHGTWFFWYRYFFWYRFQYLFSVPIVFRYLFAVPISSGLVPVLNFGAIFFQYHVRSASRVRWKGRRKAGILSWLGSCHGADQHQCQWLAQVLIPKLIFFTCFFAIDQWIISSMCINPNIAMHNGLFAQ